MLLLLPASKPEVQVIIFTDDGIESRLRVSGSAPARLRLSRRFMMDINRDIFKLLVLHKFQVVHFKFYPESQGHFCERHRKMPVDPTKNNR